jgi:hypothetical protein
MKEIRRVREDECLLVEHIDTLYITNCFCPTFCLV